MDRPMPIYACSMLRCNSRAAHVVYFKCPCRKKRCRPAQMFACAAHIKRAMREVAGVLGSIPYRAADWDEQMVWRGARA